jgi:transcriptional regulator GlxA family with amidase domain
MTRVTPADAPTGYGRRMSTATPEAAGRLSRTERVAIYLFPDMEELDFAGPWEVLSYWARDLAAGNGIAAEVVTVADEPGPVRAAKGLRVVPDTTWDELGPITVLPVPGGIGTRRMLGAGDPRHDRLHALSESGVLITSVCTGALVLAAAGLLRNRPATTHFAALELLAELDPTVEVRRDDRYVDDGAVITAAGVSAGIDMALHLVHRLDSVEAAVATRREIQYDPQPPV